MLLAMLAFVIILCCSQECIRISCVGNRSKHSQFFPDVQVTASCINTLCTVIYSFLQLGPIFYSTMHFSIDIAIINVTEPSCTSTSVHISWTTTANCITNYIINSTTSDNPITTTTSDTSCTLLEQ